MSVFAFLLVNDWYDSFIYLGLLSLLTLLDEISLNNVLFIHLFCSLLALLQK